MVKATKSAFVSTTKGTLSLTAIMVNAPQLVLSIDLGIPNFSTFTLKIPYIDNILQVMNEAFEALLDEIMALLVTFHYPELVCSALYSCLLEAFKVLKSKKRNTPAILNDTTVQQKEIKFSLPKEFLQNTYEKVVLARQQVKRVPKVKNYVVSPAKPTKTNAGDVSKIIKLYRNKTIRQQPQPLYMLLYDQKGREVGVFPVNRLRFKAKLLRTMNEQQ